MFGYGVWRVWAACPLKLQEGRLHLGQPPQDMKRQSLVAAGIVRGASEFPTRRLLLRGASSSAASSCRLLSALLNSPASCLPTYQPLREMSNSSKLGGSSLVAKQPAKVLGFSPFSPAATVMDFLFRWGWSEEVDLN